MRLFDDLKSATAMYVKAALFLVAGCIAALGLWIESPTLRTAALIAILVWSFCRLYYFCFYVIERYIDPGFRFDGLFSVLRYLIRKRTAQSDGVAETTATPANFKLLPPR